MNFLRSLPWIPLVSASFEHSRDADVRVFVAFFSVDAALVAGADVVGAALCAKAELASSRDTSAVAAMRADVVIKE
jgi:hypothetical protein